MFRTKNELVVGKPRQEPTIFLQPGQTNVANFEVTGTIPYTMDVNVTDGEVQVAMIQRPHKSPTTLSRSRSCPTRSRRCGRATPRPSPGSSSTKEQWSWVIYNDSKKPARVKVKFNAG